MATIESIRRGLIDKILTIGNKDLLMTLDKLISANKGEANIDLDELSKEQKEMLEMSETDIKNGELISQEAMNRRNLEWLNGL